MTEGEPPRGGVLRVAAVILFLVLLVFTLAVTIASIPAGAYSVYVGPLGNFTASAASRPFFWIGPALFFAPFTVAVGAAFAFLTAVYVAMLLLAAKQKAGLVGAAKKSLTGGFGELLSSPLAVVLVGTGFLVFGGSLIDDVVASLGFPIGTVSGDPLGLLLGFTASPLVEEIGFRVVLIGLVAFILSLHKPISEAARALWRPSAALEGLAATSGASVLIWAAFGLSSATFGACHVYCGTTWDIGKFPEAAFGGLVLGYLYIRYGLHVAVLAHWGVDYVGSVFSFFGQSVAKIPWNSNTQEYFGQYIVDVDFLLLFGLASFLLVSYMGLKKLGARGKEQTSVPEPFGSSYPPPAEAGREL